MNPNASHQPEQPWEPERVVDAVEARRLIEEQFPELGSLQVELLETGWDNTAFLVGGEKVFRFPRRQIAVELLEIESAVLPEVAPLLPVLVPVPTWCGRATDAFPWPFAGYPMLPGTTASRAALGDAGRAGLAEPLGRFLKVLHAISADLAFEWGAPPDRLRRLEVPYRTQKIRDRAVILVAKGEIESADADAIESLLDDMAGAARTARTTCLVHGDLYSRHLLVDEDASLCGVIDWGDVHAGDPAVDLSVAATLLPRRALDDFFQAYSDVEADTWALARLKALQTAVVIIDYGLDRQDEDLVREGHFTLRNLQSNKDAV